MKTINQLILKLIGKYLRKFHPEFTKEQKFARLQLHSADFEENTLTFKTTSEFWNTYSVGYGTADISIGGGIKEDKTND